MITRKRHNSVVVNEDSLEFRRIKHEELKLIGTPIASGAFGEVYRGTWKYSKLRKKKSVAIKVLKIMSEEEQTEHLKEIKFMAQFRHPNIVHFFGAYIRKQPYQCCIVMEYMPRGSLYKLLHEDKVQLSWVKRWQVAQDISEGLLCLHNNNIMHRDLKSGNVLIDDKLRAKLTDFGESKQKLTGDPTTAGDRKMLGTSYWMPPESFDRNKKYTKQSDIYSCGMIFWELVAQKKPQQGKSFNFFLTELEELALSGAPEEIPKECLAKFSFLIRKCWCADPEKRPLIKEIVDSLSDKKFYSDVNWNKIKPKVQQPILEHMEKIRFDSVLNLAYCTALTNDILKKILQKSPNLMELNISYCLRLTDDVVLIIAQKCKKLENLYMQGLKIIAIQNNSNKPIIFQHLKQLSLKNCSVLKMLHIKALTLNNLNTEGCINLEMVLVNEQRSSNSVINSREGVNYLAQGNELHDKKQYQQAIESYNRAIECWPECKEAFYERGDTNFILHRYSAALKDYEQFIKLNRHDFKFTGDFTNKYRIVFNYVIGGQAFDKGLYQQAIKRYTKFIKLIANEADAYRKRGDANFYLCQYSKTLEDYLKAIELGFKPTDDFSKRHQLAFFYDLLKKTKNPREKISWYNKIVELDSNNPNVYFQRAMTYEELGDYKEAIIDLNKAINLMQSWNVNVHTFPTNVHRRIWASDKKRFLSYLYFSKGNVNTLQGCATETDDDYSRALDLMGEIKRDDQRVFFNIGLLAEELGWDDLAISYFSRAAEVMYKAVYNTKRSCYDIKYGNFRKNLRAHKQAIEKLSLQPQYIKILLHKGLTGSSLDMYEEAIEDYKGVIASTVSTLSQKLLALHNKGLDEVCIGQYDEAVKTYDQALKLCSNDLEYKEIKEAIQLDRAVAKEKVLQQKETQLLTDNPNGLFHHSPNTTVPEQKEGFPELNPS